VRGPREFWRVGILQALPLLPRPLFRFPAQTYFEPEPSGCTLSLGQLAALRQHRIGGTNPELQRVRVNPKPIAGYPRVHGRRFEVVFQRQPLRWIAKGSPLKNYLGGAGFGNLLHRHFKSEDRIRQRSAAGKNEGVETYLNSRSVRTRLTKSDKAASGNKISQGKMRTNPLTVPFAHHAL